MDLKNNDYRSAPENLGAAHDPSAVRKFDLKNDAVSVVHSGETDPMPNQDAQAAYADPVVDSDAEIDPDSVDTEGNLSSAATDSDLDEEDENDYEAQQEMAELSGAEGGMEPPEEENQEDVA